MKNLSRFIRQEKGGLAVLFAIILPFIISCCALAFDGARIMTKRARLADALNEAALAIATAGSADPKGEEITKLEGMLSNYIKAYLPNEDITRSKIDVTKITDGLTDKELPVYSINAAVKVKTILPLDVFPAFAPTLDLSNQGKVRKGLQDLGQPADYVFVVDFSGSMQGSRITLLKKVVNDITSKALEAYPETTFAIVPFNVGVPVKYNKPDAISGGIPVPFEYNTNELEGALNGCSVVMVPKKKTHPNLGVEIGYDIDYDFWAYSIHGLGYLSILTDSASSIPYTIAEATKRLDNERYNYFRDFVKSSMKYKLGRDATWQDLVDEGWCINNGANNLPDRAEYSCEKDHSRFMFTTENLKKIEQQVHQAKRTFTMAQSRSSIFNPEMVDVEATLEGMFDEKNIITFPMRYMHSHGYGGDMCSNSGIQISPIGPDHLENVRHKNYLIEPTNDLAVLDEFQLMQPTGLTSSSTGLLRAVPEMLKGKNPRSVMIVISDGDDNWGDNEDISQALHMRPAGDNVCDRIRAGVRARTDAETVDIYFISVVGDASANTRTKFWADYCTGADNAFIATNYDELMDRLVEIMSGYEETGYFYN